MNRKIMTGPLGWTYLLVELEPGEWWFEAETPAPTGGTLDRYRGRGFTFEDLYLKPGKVFWKHTVTHTATYEVYPLTSGAVDVYENNNFIATVTREGAQIGISGARDAAKAYFNDHPPRQAEPMNVGAVVRVGIKPHVRVPVFDQPDKPWINTGDGIRSSWDELTAYGVLEVESTGIS